MIIAFLQEWQEAHADFRNRKLPFISRECPVASLFRFDAAGEMQSARLLLRFRRGLGLPTAAATTELLGRQ